MNERILPITTAALAICVVSTACNATVQRATTIPASAERIRADVEYLAADRLEGRGVSTAGLDSAAAWLALQFKDAGLLPKQGDDFLQDFTIDSTAPAAAHSGFGGARVRNVVGRIPGAGRLASQVLIVGAHYDHLGYGGGGSLDPDSMGVIHNGADDNASGTATMLEIARLIDARGVSSNQRAIVFVAFTAEELGLIGSAYYVEHPITPNDSAIAMLNLDMVGRMRDNKLAAFGAETATEFPSLLDSINLAQGSKSRRPETVLDGVINSRSMLRECPSCTSSRAHIPSTTGRSTTHKRLIPKARPRLRTSSQTSP